jgi:hypothetical protein
MKPIQEVLRVSVDDPSPATVTQQMVAEDGKEEADEWTVNMVAWTEEIRQIILTAPPGTFGTLLPRPPPRPLGNKAVEAAIPPIAVSEGRGTATSEAKAEEPTADTQKAAPASFKSRRILVGAKDECLPTEERRARSCDHCGHEEIGKGCKECGQFFCSHCQENGHILGRDCECKMEEEKPAEVERWGDKGEFAQSYAPGAEYHGENCVNCTEQWPNDPYTASMVCPYNCVLGKAFCRRCVWWQNHRCAERKELQIAERGTSTENKERRRGVYRKPEKKSSREIARQPINLLPTCFMKMIKLVQDKEADETLIKSAHELQKTSEVGDDNETRNVQAARWRLNDRGTKSRTADYIGLHKTCVDANAALAKQGFPAQYTLPPVDMQITSDLMIEILEENKRTSTIRRTSSR